METTILTVFGWIRIVTYLFTCVTLLLAGISFWKPMSKQTRNQRIKAYMLWSLALVFLLWLLAALFRWVVGNDQFALWVIDYPTTFAMVQVSVVAWCFIFRSAKPCLPTKTTV